MKTSIEIKQIKKNRIAITDLETNVRILSIHKLDNEWLYEYFQRRMKP